MQPVGGRGRCWASLVWRTPVGELPVSPCVHKASLCSGLREDADRNAGVEIARRALERKKAFHGAPELPRLMHQIRAIHQATRYRSSGPELPGGPEPNVFRAPEPRVEN